MNKYFKKADIVLLIVILALSVAGFILLRSSSDTNSIVEISVGGEVTETHPLYQNGTYKIETEHGYNIIRIESGQVWVSDADCANRECMSFGKMSSEGQVILCLPHKLSVRIIGGEGGPDAVSY